MPITKLHEPYWEQQEGETPHQYCWFLEYLHYPYSNIKKFRQALTEGGLQLDTKLRRTNKIPTYKTFRNYSSENKWNKRKEAYQKHCEEETTAYLRHTRLKDKEEEVRLRHSIVMNALRNIEEGINTGRLSGYNLNQSVQAVKTLNELDLLELGEATENVQQKITADIKQETKSDNELLLKVADMKKERKEVADEEN